jgi:DNA-binding transcriptional regulator YdaS (Cro superfamily)
VPARRGAETQEQSVAGRARHPPTLADALPVRSPSVESSAELVGGATAKGSRGAGAPFGVFSSMFEGVYKGVNNLSSEAVGAIQRATHAGVTPASAGQVDESAAPAESVPVQTSGRIRYSQPPDARAGAHSATAQDSSGVKAAASSVHRMGTQPLGACAAKGSSQPCKTRSHIDLPVSMQAPMIWHSASGCFRTAVPRAAPTRGCWCQPLTGSPSSARAAGVGGVHPSTGRQLPMRCLTRRQRCLETSGDEAVVCCRCRYLRLISLALRARADRGSTSV